MRRTSLKIAPLTDQRAWLIGASATGAPVQGLADFELDRNRALLRYFRFHEIDSPMIVAPRSR
jgi:hypothetical protein